MQADVMKALGDPTRCAVFEHLCRKELTVTQLTAQFEVSQPAISQHLGVLKRCGLVMERREGRFCHYRSRPEGLQPLLQWLRHYQQFWPQKMSALREILKEIPDEGK